MLRKTPSRSQPGSSAPANARNRIPGLRNDWVIALLICAAAVALYGDTAGMEFTAEDYQRINRHAADLQTSALGPLQTPSSVSPRFRPVQFYMLALEYRFFGTDILPYRLLTLLLLSLNGFLFFDLLHRAWGVARAPALAGTLLALAHFARVEVVYQQAGTFYLPGELLFLLLLRRLFPVGRGAGPWLVTALLFAMALLTVQTTVIFLPLALYILARGKEHANRFRDLAQGALLLGAPLAVLFFLERLRSGPLPILLSSPVQIAKNFIVLTSCIFYDFKPIGFSTMLRSGSGGEGFLPFVFAHPSAVAMVVISLLFVGSLARVALRGDDLNRFFALGIVSNTLAFMVYPGVSARFLTFSVLFLTALCARACSLHHVRPRNAWVGLLLVLAPYSVYLSLKERRPWVDEIRHLESLRASPRREGLTAEDEKAAADLRIFWRGADSR